MRYNIVCKHNKNGVIDLYVDDRLISPSKSQALRNHSPDGFNAGYGGSGPAQLALGIMREFTTPEWASRLYQQFKWDFLAKEQYLHNDFEIPICEVVLWLSAKMKEHEVLEVL